MLASQVSGQTLRLYLCKQYMHTVQYCIPYTTLYCTSILCHSQPRMQLGHDSACIQSTCGLRVLAKVTRISHAGSSQLAILCTCMLVLANNYCQLKMANLITFGKVAISHSLFNQLHGFLQHSVYSPASQPRAFTQPSITLLVCSSTLSMHFWYIRVYIRVQFNCQPKL